MSSTDLDKDYRVISLYSEWIGGSEMRVKVRYFSKKNSILVDVTELSTKFTSKKRALKAATNAARKVGVPNIDCIHVSDFEFVRNSCKLDDNFTPTRTLVRQTTFAFDGIVE